MEQATPLKNLDGPPPEAILMQMLFGTLMQQSIRAAAKLGIADLLVGQSQTAAELADKTKSHYPSLYRVLRVLASVGIFAENSAGRFELTPMANLLRNDAPNSMRDFAIMQGEEWNLRGAAELMHTIKTGATAQSKAHGMELFEFLSQHPQDEVLFNRAMTSYSLAAIPAIVEAYDFSGFHRIIDIAGGHGILLSGILKANLHGQGVLFDLPSVIAGASELLEKEGVGNRVESIAGDFFHSVPPGGDAYILKNIIHDWNDEQSISILKNIQSVMNATSKVLLIELIIPEGNEPSLSKLVDLQMLVTTGGKERTEDEFRRILEASGLRLTKIYPTKSPLSLIEAERI
jgi:hypothetical protein